MQDNGFLKRLTSGWLVSVVISATSFAFAAESVPIGVLVKFSTGERAQAEVKRFDADSPTLPPGWVRILSGSDAGINENSAGGLRLFSAKIEPGRFVWLRSTNESVLITKPSQYGRAWDEVYRRLASPELLKFSLNIQSAEPSVQVLREASTKGEKAPSNRTDSGSDKLNVLESWGKAWPHGEIAAWHLESNRTELNDALAEVEAYAQSVGTGFRPARVAIIDTWFDTNNPSLRGIYYVPGGIRTNQHNSGIIGGKSHGTGTLSILAGQRVFVQRTSDGPSEVVHGANPHAEILPIAGAKGVAHIFDTASIVEGLETAIANKAEIVSMSMGGWPSSAVRDAVNKAYTNGVAVFAASGDYLVFPFLPVMTPSFMVYPAAYDSCIGVAGITAREKSYARANSLWGWICDYRHWKMRGSAGPEWVMDRAVSAYSPNIAWAVMDETRAIDLDGAGTSASTPQAAGAASLWFEKHREKVEALSTDAPWKRSELIFQAILRGSVQPEQSPSRADFGAGVIKAARTLHLEPDPSWLPEKPKIAKRSLNWILLLASIVYHREPAIQSLHTLGSDDKRSERITEVYRNAVARSATTTSADAGIKLMEADPAKSDLVRVLGESLAVEAEQKLFRSGVWLSLHELPQDVDHQPTKSEVRIAKRALRELEGSDSSRLLRGTLKELRRQLAK